MSQVHRFSVPANPKPRADRPPFACSRHSVMYLIPACLHLAYENHFGSVYVDCPRRPKFPASVPAVDDRAGRLRTENEPWATSWTVPLRTAFFCVLPVAIGGPQPMDCPSAPYSTLRIGTWAWNRTRFRDSRRTSNSMPEPFVPDDAPGRTARKRQSVWLPLVTGHQHGR